MNYIYAKRSQFPFNQVYKAQTKQEKGVVVYYHFFKKNTNFSKNIKKIKKKRILQIFDLNTLKSRYNKDLQNIISTNTLHISRFTRYEKIQNELNYNKIRTKSDSTK